jgi:hypothetical protein
MNDAGPVQEYLVLARKYRSRTFAELIGQDALVRTLTNAVAAGKLHHAYVLTGIRGTGKTSTARLLAMALNCENGPSVTWAEDDPAVQAIRAGLARHPDVGIKASGGIRTLASAIEFAAAGVDRIGSSATVQILSDFRKLLAETAPRKSPV